jgi:hypothetical protein
MRGNLQSPSIILLKHKSKCHVASPRSPEILISIEENQGKKKDLDPLFYIKCFGQLIFNPSKTDMYLS